MASTIQIKNGTGSAVPSSLLQGELALNVHSGKLFYGTSGSSNSVSSSFTFDDLTVTNLTSTNFTSSIITSSVIITSGSNIFGDTGTDSHTFNGVITASNGISGSSTSTFKSATGSYHILQGDTTQPTALYIDGHITSSGEIWLADSKKLVLGNKAGGDGNIKHTGANLQISETTGHIQVTNYKTDGDIVLSTDDGSGGETAYITLDGGDVSTTIHTNLTHSGDISSSGTLLMGTPGVNVTHTFYGRIKTIGSEVFLGDGNISASGHITASGNISSSAIIQGMTGSFGTGTTTITDKIHTTGEISGSKIDAPSIETDLIEVKSGGKLKIKGSDITLENGNISMSGDLVITGSISGSASSTGSFAHIITGGETIEFKSGATKLGSIKFDQSKGFQVKDSNDNSGKLDAKELIVANSISMSGLFEIKNGHLTGSNISASGEIITPTLKGGGNTTGLIVAGYTNVQGAITASGDISSSQTVVARRLKAVGSLFDTLDGNITASGDISSSLSVRALTGSFGTGTTHVHDSIQTAGSISSSGEFIGLRLTVNEKIKVKGSDITLEGGNISASGHITASGNISSSAVIQGMTGSFGTGTTTITDFIHTTGNITGSYIEAPRVVSDLLEVKPGGKLKVKGSDITMENGHISMSGDLLMTGSITAGGNVTAGTDGTGSFDHIITMDDTIEFRNKSNRSQIKGYMKFDPEEGLIPLSGSNKERVHSTIKIKPTDFYPIGSTVGGKGAGGIATLQPRTGNSSVIASAAAVFTCEVTIPKGLTPGNVVVFGSDTTNTYQVYVGTLANNNTATNVTPAASSVAVGTLCNPSTTFSKAGITWNSNNHYLIIYVTTNGADEIYGGTVAIS